MRWDPDAPEPQTETSLTPEALGLRAHPEGGWFRETWRTTQTVDTERGERSLATCITYLLQPGERSGWHRVQSAEMWLWQGGGELRLGLGGFAAAPVHQRHVVLSVGVQHVVEAGEWQRAEPAGSDPVLVACVVSPGFDFADFELA
jgi:uncharacterized protein